MRYDIHITHTAENDINDAADYIEFILLNPTAADDLLDDAEAEIKRLTSFPEKHQLIDDPVLQAWGIRFIVVNNYLAFYVISEPEKTVYIVRFLYTKRDWITILKKGFTLD